MKEFLARFKLNNKGFTLVEVVAAVIIVITLTGAAYAAVSSVTVKAHQDFCSTQMTNLVVAGRDYFSDNRLLLPNDFDKTSCVSLEKLEQDKYIEGMTDYSNNSCDGTKSRVCAVKDTASTFQYIPTVDCNNCTSDNAEVQNIEVTPEIIFSPNSRVVTSEADKNIGVDVTVKINGNGKTIVNYSYQVYKIENTSGFDDADSFDIVGNLDSFHTETLVKGSNDYRKYRGDFTIGIDTPGHYYISVTAVNEDGTKAVRRSGRYEVVYDEVCASISLDGKYTVNKGADNQEGPTDLDTSWHRGVFDFKVSKKTRVDHYTVKVVVTPYDSNGALDAYELSTTKNIVGNKSYSFDTNKTAMYDFIVTAYDSKGSKCTRGWSFKQDNMAPSCQVLGLYKEKEGERGSGIYSELVPSDSYDLWHNTYMQAKGLATDNQSGFGGVNTTEVYATYKDRDYVSWMKPGTAIDEAGNEVTCGSSVRVQIDTEAPSCSTSRWVRERNDNSSSFLLKADNKFTNTNQKVIGSCGDIRGPSVIFDGLGTQSSGCETDSVESPEYTNHDIALDVSPGVVKDRAGNTTSCGVETIKIDKTAPVCKMDVYMKNENNKVTNYEIKNGITTVNWFNYNLKVKGKCQNVKVRNEANSNEEIGSDCSDNVITSELLSSDRQADYSFPSSNNTVYDDAGNAAVCGTTPVWIDKTKPACGTEYGDRSSDDWLGTGNTATVGVECYDEEKDVDGRSVSSGIKDTNKCKKILNTEGLKETVNFSIEDNAGNVRTCSKTFTKKLDYTSPVCGTWSGEAVKDAFGNYVWAENRTISLTGNYDPTPDGIDGISGLEDDHASISWTFPEYDGENNITTKQLSYTIKDKASNQTVCSRNAKIYVDAD